MMIIERNPKLIIRDPSGGGGCMWPNREATLPHFYVLCVQINPSCLNHKWVHKHTRTSISFLYYLRTAQLSALASNNGPEQMMELQKG